MQKWEEETWNVVVAWHNCPHLHIEDGCKYCLHEQGSEWCQKEECPITTKGMNDE